MGLVVGIIVVIILLFGVFFVLGSAIGGILGVLGVVALIWIAAGYIISNAKDGSITAVVLVVALALTIGFFASGACNHVFNACFNVPSGCIDSVDHYPGRMMVCNGKTTYRPDGKCP